jgi:hypothetical protein
MRALALLATTGIYHSLKIAASETAQFASADNPGTAGMSRTKYAFCLPQSKTCF